MSSEVPATVSPVAPAPSSSPKASRSKGRPKSAVTKPAKAPKVKKPKAPKGPKVPSSHPTYGDMVRRAVTELKDKKGSSRAGILKYILQHFKVGENVVSINSHLRQALKRGVASGALSQVKGVGASGSFRLGTKEATKKIAKKSAKPKSPKKKTAAVAGASTAAPKAKKSPKKAKAAKKPAAKKPAAKKAASPKKAKAAKPKTAKKPAAKKASPKKRGAPKKAVAAPTPVVAE
jgi:histone H1/5